MNKPFARSYWVQEELFLAGYTPASEDHSVMQNRLQGLLRVGISCFINLMEPNELDHEKKPFDDYVPMLKKLAAEQGIQLDYHNIPIVDRNIPSEQTMRGILDTIDKSMALGKPVYVHCWGGKGRTGTVVACWLSEKRQMSGLDAIATIAELRIDDPKRDDPSPETLEQIEFVINWANSAHKVFKDKF